MTVISYSSWIAVNNAASASYTLAVYDYWVFFSLVQMDCFYRACPYAGKA